MNQPPVRIKRYQNRKLYDTELSRYVQLDDIAKLIKKGRSIEVVDNKRHSDITDLTLMSVIHQNETAAKSKALPMGFMMRVLAEPSLTTYATELERRLQ